MTKVTSKNIVQKSLREWLDEQEEDLRLNRDREFNTTRLGEESHGRVNESWREKGS